jgi:hypothetical protein
MLRCVRMSQMRYDPRGVLNFAGSAMNLSLERIGAIFHEAAVPIEIVNPFNYAWVECCDSFTGTGALEIELSTCP